MTMRLAPIPSLAKGAPTPTALLESSRGTSHPVRPEIKHGSWLQLLLATGFAFATYGIPQALNPAGDKVSGPVSIVFVLLATAITLSISPSLFIYYWVALVIYQNFAVGIWHGSSAFQNSILATEMKTVALILATALSLPAIGSYLSPSRRRFPRLLIASFLGICLLSLRSLDTATFGYARNFLGPLIALVLFSTLTSSLTRMERLLFLRRLTVQMTTVLFLGECAELFLGTPRWRSWLNVASEANFPSNPTQTTFLGHPISRIGGVLIDPTDAGYAVAVIIAAAILSHRLLKAEGYPDRFPFWTVALATISLLATAAKDGILFLVTLLVVFFLVRKGRHYLRGFVGGSAFAIILVTAYVIKVWGFTIVRDNLHNPVKIVGKDSTTYHFAGFVYGLKGALLHPVGHGLGNGGDFSYLPTMTLLQWLHTGSESGWGVIAYQLGAIGVLIWILVYARIGRYLGREAFVLMTAWMVAAIFCENLLGLPIAGLAMVACALVSRPPDDAVLLPSTSAKEHLARKDTGALSEPATT